MAQISEDTTQREPTNDYSTYDLFILLLSVLSLILLLIIVFPIGDGREGAIAYVLDTVLSLIFLADFFRSLYRAPDRRGYLKRDGWLDLLGSIPAIPVFRLFRLARALRIIRTMRQMGGRELMRSYRANRADSALWTAAFAIILLFSTTALIIVPVEAQSPDAQITSSADALWWSMVTATTVGYGDMVPVTRGGRLLAVILMTVGVGFVSILTSYFVTKLYVADSPEGADANEEAAQLHERLDQISQQLERIEDLVQGSQPST